jgi:hypothetical protein
MQNIRVQPFSQFTNWFRLRPGEGSIYKVHATADTPESVEVFTYRENLYSLQPTDKCESIVPTGDLLRRSIGRAFREALRLKGFRFKGKGGYVAFWHKHPAEQPHNDIFSAFTTSFEFRIVEYSDGETPAYYLVLDPHVAFTINVSVAELVAKGLPLSRFADLAVRVKSDGDQRTGGIDDFLVETVRQDSVLQCRIINFASGEENYQDAATVYLEPRPEIIRSLLVDLGYDFDVVRFQQEKSFLMSSVPSKDRFKKTQEIVRDYLVERAGVFPLMVGGIQVDIDADPTPVTGTGFPRAGQLSEPRILFDKSDSSAVHLQAYWGLRTFGPYTKDRPTIKLALLGSKTGLKNLRDLVNNLNEGTRIMPGGVRQFFNTRLETADEEEITSEALENYIKAAHALGGRSDKRGIDVVLVHLARPTADFELDTPYYNVKPILLEYGLPSQMITAGKLTGSNAQWLHADVASGIFAKAGGHPWVLADDIEDFDLILGVGLSTAISKTKRAGARPRYIGFANVFDERGRWMFFESTSALYDSERHAEQLAELVSMGIDRYQIEQKRKPHSIAIHYYKHFSRAEKEATERTLKEKVGDYRVAFITIDKSHPMRLYDLLTQDGSFPRAHYAQISDSEFLLSTTGHTELARKRLGTPAILKVSMTQSPQSFVSLPRIAEQVLALTRLNYKTVTPVVGEPVTLSFSNLVANFMAVFSEHQWKEAQESKRSNVNTRPWFL